MPTVTKLISALCLGRSSHVSEKLSAFGPSWKGFAVLSTLAESIYEGKSEIEELLLNLGRNGRDIRCIMAAKRTRLAT